MIVFWNASHSGTIRVVCGVAALAYNNQDDVFGSLFCEFFEVPTLNHNLPEGNHVKVYQRLLKHKRALGVHRYWLLVLIDYRRTSRTLTFGLTSDQFLST